MPGCCQHHEPTGTTSARYRRVLWTVIALNLVMFAVEMIGGIQGKSLALQADALDFLGDSITYAMTLAVLGSALRVRATAALIKGASLALLAAWILGTAIYRIFILGEPSALVMGAIGTLALAANVASALLLMRYREGDANVRSVWLCSRNDAIGNCAVLAAALLVAVTHTPWPDLAVAAAMAALFLNSSIQIVRQSLGELASDRAAEAEST